MQEKNLKKKIGYTIIMSPYFLSGKSERFDLSFFCCPRKETGLHIVQEIYKMTTILNQKQIP